jgi:alkylation response protein AidB-like acyl-CoA dehydrogenase
VHFRFDPEHEQLRAAVERFLRDFATEQDVRATMETQLGWDPDLVKRLAGEIGAFGLIVPERYGGAGFGMLELGVVLMEAGRALLCAPLLSAALAAQTFVESGDDAACATYLPGIASGELVAGVATHEPGRGWWMPPGTLATQTRDGWQLTGTKDWVLDGHAATLVLVAADTEAGPSLFLVDADSSGFVAEPLATVDATRRAARIGLSATPGTPLGRLGTATEVLAGVGDVALTLLAAEEVGVAQRCLDMAVGYAKQREQFGRPIGSFQAVKHKLADVELEVQAALSAAMFALWAADKRPEELPQAARIAAYTCAEAAMLAAGENIQVHGGMGATWEHPAHLYLRRATVSRQLFGDPQLQLETLARSLESSS